MTSSSSIVSAPSVDAEHHVEDPTAQTQVLARVPRAISPALRFHDDPRPLDLAQHLVVLAFSGALAPWVALMVDTSAPVALAVVVASLSGSLVASARRHGWRPDLDLRLRLAQRALARRSVTGRRTIRALVAASSPEVATEARGRLALDALARGDISEAIELTRVSAYNPGLRRQRRGLGRGLVGELVRSILAGDAPEIARRPTEEVPRRPAVLWLQLPHAANLPRNAAGRSKLAERFPAVHLLVFSPVVLLSVVDPPPLWVAGRGAASCDASQLRGDHSRRIV